MYTVYWYRFNKKSIKVHINVKIYYCAYRNYYEKRYKQMIDMV